jgi:hypothetical protein
MIQSSESDMQIQIHFSHQGKPDDQSTLQDTLFLPSLPQQPYTYRCIKVSFDIPNLQQLVLTSESEEMRKHRVEVWFRSKMEDLRIVRVIDVRKYPKELAVDMFDGGGEGRVKVLT